MGMIAKILDYVTNGRYTGVKTALKEFSSNGRELLDYIDGTINTIAYNSRGLVGAYADVRSRAPQIQQKVDRMRGNISSLEQLLSFRRKPQDNKLDRQDTPEKPSSIAPDSAEGTRKHAYHLISKELLHDVIVMKNSYMNPHKPLDALESRVQVLAGFPRGKNIENVLHQAMKLKTSDKEYADLPSIKYDSRIAPRPMQNEMVMLYATSDMTLREASIYLESRYGMHISASTLSRHARDCLKNNGQEFKNRHEAKRHYQEDIKGSSLKAAVS